MRRLLILALLATVPLAQAAPATPVPLPLPPLPDATPPSLPTVAGFPASPFPPGIRPHPAPDALRVEVNGSRLCEWPSPPPMPTRPTPEDAPTAPAPPKPSFPPPTDSGWTREGNAWRHETPIGSHEISDDGWTAHTPLEDGTLNGSRWTWRTPIEEWSVKGGVVEYSSPIVQWTWGGPSWHYHTSIVDWTVENGTWRYKTPIVEWTQTAASFRYETAIVDWTWAGGAWQHTTPLENWTFDADSWRRETPLTTTAYEGGRWTLDEPSCRVEDDGIVVLAVLTLNRTSIGHGSRSDVRVEADGITMKSSPEDAVQEVAGRSGRFSARVDGGDVVVKIGLPSPGPHRARIVVAELPAEAPKAVPLPWLAAAVGILGAAALRRR